MPWHLLRQDQARAVSGAGAGSRRRLLLAALVNLKKRMQRWGSHACVRSECPRAEDTGLAMMGPYTGADELFLQAKAAVFAGTDLSLPTLDLLEARAVLAAVATYMLW